jgi:glucuronate isomerase
LTRSRDSSARDLADQLYESVKERPLVSVHSGLPARYLAEDLPLLDPLALLISHDQAVQALLRAHGVHAEFSPHEGWQSESSRRAFALLWDHLVAVRAQPWMKAEGDEIAAIAGLPPLRTGRPADDVYDELAARLITDPVHPRRVLTAAKLATLLTSDEPADDLEAHAILALDPDWAGRVAPTFSADRYLQPDGRRWCTDGDLLAEITGVDTADLAGFLAALRRRRDYFVAHGAAIAEFHASDVGVSRLDDREAAGLYLLARTGELMPAEVGALRRHLLWEMGAMSAEDGLVMALYPPAGFHGAGDTSPDDRGISGRVRSLLTDFGSEPRFRLWLFSIDVDAYVSEIVPMAAGHQVVTAPPPTRFADDPDELRRARVTAIRALGPARVLGLVDDMSGPFAMPARHRLARRLDAGALAELVLDGQLAENQAFTALAAGPDQSIVGSPAARAG